MNCPNCQGSKGGVYDSRADGPGGAIRRRRKCKLCSHRWCTVEVAVIEDADWVDRVSSALEAAEDLVKGARRAFLRAPVAGRMRLETSDP